MSQRLLPHCYARPISVDLDAPPPSKVVVLQTHRSVAPLKERCLRTPSQKTSADLVLAVFENARKISWSPAQFNQKLKEANNLRALMITHFTQRLNKPKEEDLLEDLIQRNGEIRDLLITTIDSFCKTTTYSPFVKATYHHLLEANRALCAAEAAIRALKTD